MNVGYGLRVAPSAEIDRTAWAALVTALIASEAGGNQTKFAAKVGVTARTVERWQKSQVDVKPQSVIDVARALDRSPVGLLVRIGYFSAEEGGAGEDRTPYDPDVRRLLKLMADPDVSEEDKDLIRRQLRILNEQVERALHRGRTADGQPHRSAS